MYDFTHWYEVQLKIHVVDKMVFYFILSLLGNFFSTLGLIEAAKKVYKTLIKILELNFDEIYDTIVYSAFDQSWKYRCNHPVVIKVRYIITKRKFKQ